MAEFKSPLAAFVHGGGFYFFQWKLAYGCQWKFSCNIIMVRRICRIKIKADVVLLLHLILQNCKTSLSGHISFKATLRPTTFCPQMYQYWREPIWLVLTCYSLINKAKPPKLINAPARHLGRVIEYTWTPMLAQTATPDVTHARRQV